MKTTVKKNVRLLPQGGYTEPINDKPSMTEPNQVPKLVEVLKMAAMGKPLTGYDPQYSEEDISEFDNLDKVERLQERQRILEKIDDLKERHHLLTKLHDQKIQEEAEQAAYERLKNEKNEEQKSDKTSSTP